MTYGGNVIDLGGGGDEIDPDPNGGGDSIRILTSCNTGTCQFLEVRKSCVGPRLSSHMLVP